MMEELKFQRIKHLKEVKRLANFLLKENIEIQKKRKSAWETQINENNIFQLKSIIKNANKELQDDELRQFVEKEIEKQSIIPKQSILANSDVSNHINKLIKELELFEILRYSPAYSIAYDLYWIEDGTLGEQMDLVYGRCSPDIYEQYCLNKIEQLKNEVIPQLERYPEYYTTCTILKNIINGFNSNSYIVSNIVLITVVESMVRQLCRFVYKHQNPTIAENEIDKYIEAFTSLERLILNKSWKDDFEVQIHEAYLMSKYIKDDTLDKVKETVSKHQDALVEIWRQNKLLDTKLEEWKRLEEKSSLKPDDETIKHQMKEAQERSLNQVRTIRKITLNLIPSEQLKANVSLRVKLQFLVRRFKEDRNSIIHGNYQNFDKGWKSYIYLSAIAKVSQLIKAYSELYEKE